MNRLMRHLYHSLQQLWRRLLSLPRRGKYEREMEEEMRFHLETQIGQNIDAGMAAEEECYAARRQFGSNLPTKAIDKVKAQGGTRMYDVIYSICEEEMMAPTSDII